MITLASLKAWGLAASIYATGGHAHLSDAVLDGMATAALTDPIIPGDDESVKALMRIEVALAFFETGAQMTNDPSGPNDGGQSHCWAQIYLPNGARTREGWTGAELRHDPLKCAKVAVRLIKASLLASPDCSQCGLTVYARGRDTEEGRRLSRTRMGLAQRLGTEVPWKDE